MNKQLSCALLTIGLISFNAMPAKAMSDNLSLTHNLSATLVTGQFCIFSSWVGKLCIDF